MFNFLKYLLIIIVKIIFLSLMPEILFIYKRYLLQSDLTECNVAEQKWIKLNESTGHYNTIIIIKIIRIK